LTFSQTLGIIFPCTTKGLSYPSHHLEVPLDPKKKLPLPLDIHPTTWYNTHMNKKKTNTTEMTFEEFTTKLRYADWFYMMSDDSRSYNAGRDQIQRLKNLAASKGGEWQEAFAAKSKEMMSRLHG